LVVCQVAFIEVGSIREGFASRYAPGSVQEVLHGGVGFHQDRIGLAAGGKSAFVVGVTFEQVTLDAPGRGVGDVRAAGVFEENVGTVERRELLADDGDVEGQRRTPWLDYIFPSGTTAIAGHAFSGRASGLGRFAGVFRGKPLLLVITRREHAVTNTKNEYRWFFHNPC
jgi:hypothetical protein